MTRATMRVLLLYVLAFAAAAPATAGTYPIQFTASNTEGGQCPGDTSFTPERPETSGLAFHRVYRVRYRDMDTSAVLDIPWTGEDTVRVDVPKDSLGTLGQMWVTAFDRAGNESCVGMRLTYAIPLEEATTPPQPAPAPGPGSNAGLLASYFRDTSLGVGATQIDSTVNFSWGDGAIWPGGPGDNASARWTGIVTIPTSGDWTYCVGSDDGHRLKSDGALVIDKWGSRWEENCWTGFLTAGPHAIELEYLELGGGALCQLRWSGPGVGKEIIPASALSH